MGTETGTFARTGHYEKTAWRFLRKLQRELPYDPATPLFLFTQGKGNEVLQRTLHAQVTAPLFATAKVWNQPKCPRVDGRIKKRWYLDTTDYDYVFKGKEIFSFTTTQINLEGTVLLERQTARSPSQPQPKSVTPTEAETGRWLSPVPSVL